MPSEQSVQLDASAGALRAAASQSGGSLLQQTGPPRSPAETRPVDTEGLARQQGRLIGLVADVLDERTFQAAAMAVVSRLGRLFQCERVSLGVVENDRIEVVALSNTAEFENSATLVRDISHAMEEAVVQGCTIQYPSASDSVVVGDAAHAELARLRGDLSVCSIPLVAEDSVFGVLTLENFSVPISQEFIALAEHASLLLTPILKLKQSAEEPAFRRLVGAGARLLGKLFGPRHLLLKLMLGLLAAVVGTLVTVDSDYRIVADAGLEARDVHAVVSPARGYISKIHKRAGDLVDVGTPLAELDRRDLAVELDKWRTELSKNTEEQHAALAARDRRQTRVLKLQEQQIQAQIRLVENLIERGDLVSPVKGIVNSADPNHSYGSPVERGELLFEIAPLTSYKLVLKVDESDISEVRAGDVGRLVLSGRPFEPLRFNVTHVIPLSESSGGKNRFRVEASLEDDPDWIRPGMQGVAKISVGDRRLAWIWTHRLLDALQLTWWRWGWA